MYEDSLWRRMVKVLHRQSKRGRKEEDTKL